MSYSSSFFRKEKPQVTVTLPRGMSLVSLVVIAGMDPVMVVIGSGGGRSGGGGGWWGGG